MANPEWDNYNPKRHNCLTEKAMQEQDLTNYYKHIFTLKSGKQIEILTREWLDLEHDYGKETNFKYPAWKIIGFILNPLFVEKEVIIRQEDVSAMESIKDPCIAQVVPWPEEIDVNSEIDPGAGVKLTMPDAALGSGHYDKPLVEHKSTCTFILASEAGKISSEDIQCDCGVIVPCANNKPIEDMTTKEIIEHKD